ncbi:MAG: hydroxymethylbilane synthase [Syntrophales bacterium]
MKDNNNYKLKIGTRGSALALRQTQIIAGKISARYPDLRLETVTIKTTGDKLHDVALAKMGGKGVFVKEIEEALLKNHVDIAVHSMKDVPSEIPAALEIAVVPEREDPRDVLVSRDHRKIGELPEGARIGTGSLRRAIQVKHWFPYVEVVSIRGNLDTRIRKVGADGLDGIIVAAAGMNRMGWMDRAAQFISPKVLIPAIGQGALAIEVRKDDARTRRIVSFLRHEESFIRVMAERSFLQVFGGGCQLPIAAYAEINGGDMHLRGLIGSLDGLRIIRDEISGRPEDCEELGKTLAEMILAKGGREILK